MLECKSCLLRCLRAICHDLPLSTLTSAQRRLWRASFSSKSHTLSRYASSLSIRERSSTVKPENSIIKAVKSWPVGAQTLPDGITSAQARRLRLELPWLSGDRLKLLKRTKELLRDRRHTEALELVRLASKGQPCTIAWNAILDDMLVQNKVNAAFKTYNEMKKRGQIPDSYTYSTLFNGLTAHAKTPNVGTRAAALWQSLNSPNSKVKPSILLTNAALKVCASVKDIDALWTIAGAIPDQGAEAANSITYTTILNAMRFSTELKIGSEGTEEQHMALDTAVAQGRQIWADIISRWASAKLTLDENLVNAMGGLLLAGLRPQDWDDVFSLCAQTMNIPRQPPPLEAKDRSYNPNKRDQIPAPFGRSDRTIDAAPGDVSTATGKEFSIVPKKKGIWIKATNQTLTLLIETCQKMFLARAAEKYWKLLTGPGEFAIKPDSVSLHAYLRLLRQTKASAEAVRFVRDDMRDISTAGKTYRIAMSTCVRNQFSRNAMREATELMDIMLTRMSSLDLKASIMYMKLALESPHAQDTLVALGYMTPQRTRLHELLKAGSPQDNQTLLDLSKLVVSSFDRVIEAQTVSDQRIADYKERKATWTYAVQRLLNGGERVRPTMSDEELTLLAKKKALSRFQKKRGRDQMRERRKGSRPVAVKEHERDGFPVLESDAI